MKQQPRKRLLILCPNAKRSIAATAWASGNTPKGIPLLGLDSAKCRIFICQNTKEL